MAASPAALFTGTYVAIPTLLQHVYIGTSDAVVLVHVACLLDHTRYTALTYEYVAEAVFTCCSADTYTAPPL